jgi:hypothetical protein
MKINNWKEYWLERQQDQARKKDTRAEKKKIRRLYHKSNRKRAREQMNEYESYDKEDLEELE